METRNTHLLLFSAAFLILGFLLGRMTAKGGHGPRGPHAHGEFHWVEDGEAQVEVAVLADTDFEGDTAFALPGGGKVNVMRNGDEYEVEVEVDEKARDGEVRLQKRVIMIQEED
ncbi:MAG: hypothetical protein ACPG66_07915 [Flavobacteriales bacterium]